MKHAFVFILCCNPWSLDAQQPAAIFEKAPPVIEEALKARVTAFWDAQCAKKFRLADQYVAEEAKDLYFGDEKINCRSWEYSKATYEENFTKARVLINCETPFDFGGNRVWVKRPVLGFWRVVDGKWFWTTPPKTKGYATPFGVMGTSDTSADGSLPPNSFKIPATVEGMLSRVQINRKIFQLKASEASSDEIDITNETGVNISLTAAIPSGVSGLDVQINKKDLKHGETAKVLVKSAGEKGAVPHSAKLGLRVDPFGQEIPLEVKFQ